MIAIRTEPIIAGPVRCRAPDRAALRNRKSTPS
jgi:hypothetical protein